MEKLFVLAGKARSGKDSVAKIIKDYYQDKVVLLYPCTLYLKKYIGMIYGWDGSEEDKPRKILQDLGRDIKEKYPDFFIDRMREDIAFLSNRVDVIIVTGVRLKKELEFLKNNYNCVLIKVEKDKLDDALTMDEKNDITETDVDNFGDYNYIISNNASLVDLKNETLKILKEV